MTIQELFRQIIPEHLEAVCRTMDWGDGVDEVIVHAWRECLALVPESPPNASYEVVLEVLDEQVDVCLRDGNAVSYSMDLMPWRNALACTIGAKTLALYPPATLAAHILYEMTFWGQSADEIEEEIAELERRASSLDAAIPWRDEPLEIDDWLYSSPSSEEEAP